MRNLRVLVLLSLSLSLALPCLALAAVDLPGAFAQPFTLDQVLRLAREKNRDIKAAREHLRQASADIDRAMAPLLPIVNAQGKYTHNNTEIAVSFAPGPLATMNQQLLQDTLIDLNNRVGGKPSDKVLAEGAAVSGYCAANPKASECAPSGPVVIQKQEQLDANLSASVPLVVPYAYAQLRGARQAFLAQEKTTDATETALLVQVAAAFYAATGTDEVVAARRHGVEVAQRTLTDAESRFAAGVVNRVDVARAKVAVLRAEQAQREAIDSTTSAYRSLRTLAGIVGPFTVVAPEEPKPVDRDVPTLVRSALSLRPEVLAYDRNIIAADANKLSNDLRWLPSLSAFGLVRAYNNGGFNNQFVAAAVGVQLDWLIYDGGIRQAGAKQFASMAREFKLRREQLKDQIADEVKNYLDSLETKRRGLSEARQEVQLAQETLELVRVQRDAGIATQLDLLTAQDTLVLAELTVARLRFDLGLTEVQLERAAGTFH